MDECMFGSNELRNNQECVYVWKQCQRFFMLDSALVGFARWWILDGGIWQLERHLWTTLIEIIISFYPYAGLISEIYPLCRLSYRRKGSARKPCQVFNPSPQACLAPCHHTRHIHLETPSKRQYQMQRSTSLKIILRSHFVVRPARTHLVSFFPTPAPL